MKTKYFVHNGKLITASSKKEAIRKILQRKVVASYSKNKEIEDFLVKCLRKAVDENFIREYSKEIEDIFDEYFWWNSSKKQYEYEIYKDYSDTLEPWWFKHNKVYSFDAYWNALFEAYIDAENEPFDKTLDSLVELCENNGVEIDEDVARNYIRDYVPVEYPNFLDDEIDVTFYIKSSPEIVKMIFGTNSTINIANKFIKGNLRQDLQEFLQESLENILDEDELKDVSAVSKELNNIFNNGDLLCGNDSKMTVEQFLSTQEPDDDRAVKYIDLTGEYVWFDGAAYGNGFKLINGKIPIKCFDSNYTDVGIKDI